jgi:protocatechuate 3,4-dioxygenase beta subunit
MRIVVVILMNALALAQAPGQAPQDKARIEGTLINQATGGPLRKGTISLSAAVTGQQSSNTPAPIAYAVMSDAEGRFVIEGVDPGRYKMTADHAGYIRLTYRSGGSGFLSVSPGQTLKDIRLAITPQGVIAGRVVDEDGDPLTEVTVQAFVWRTINGVRRLGFARYVQVDDQGNFRVANLEAGSYVLSAHLDRMPPVNADKIHDAYITTYYPSALEISETTQIPLIAGAEATNIEIRLRRARVFHIRGKVVDASGSPVQSTALALNRSGGLVTDVSGDITISRDGAFDFANVRPGSYYIEPANNVLFATDQGGGSMNKKLFAHYTVTVADEDVKDITLQLHAGATLTGTISTEDATAQTTSAKPLLPTIRLQPLDSPDVSPATASSKADGTFELHDVAPRHYRVNVIGTTEGSYVKSVRFGGEDITNGTLDLTDGSGGAIEIKLSPSGATVSGTVQNANGDPVGDVLVTIGPKAVEATTESLFFRKTRTDQNGQFSIKSLPPGEYRVLAWEDVDEQLVTDPEFRAHFDGNSAEVTLSENSKQTAELKLVPRDAIDAEAAKVR